MPVVRRDVTSLSKSGSAKLKGDVTLSEGTNVTITQSGQDIEIASTGSGGGTVDSVVAGNNIDVDATDPANPVVSVETLTLSDISDVTATATEVNYTDGVTSAIQTQLDAKATSTELSNHIADTTTHGTTGDIVGTSDSQTLTNKTIDGDDNTIQDLGTSSLKDDAVTAAKMQYGTFRARQGGTSGDASWYSSGTTNTDTSAKAVFIQGGRIATSAAGDTTITFPNAYTYAPLVIATTSSAGAANSFAIVVATTTTTVTVRTINDSGARVAENLNWVAYGQ